MRVLVPQRDVCLEACSPTWRGRHIAIAVGLVIAAIPWAAAEPLAPCAGLSQGPLRTVTRVLDGETVALDDGSELRLIGALAPRAVDVDANAGKWPAEAATMEALSALALGKSVELRFSDGRSERTDRYRRLQAQAYVLEGGTRRWLQGELVERGLARAYILAGDSACAAQLLALESSARAAHRGLWREAAYQVRPADKPVELKAYRATFQVIAGTIVGVSQRRDIVYLNFDRNWREGFSVSLRRDGRTLPGAYTRNPRALEGRNVRVHGWIDYRRGAPAIDLSVAGAIEVIDEADASPGQAR